MHPAAAFAGFILLSLVLAFPTLDNGFSLDDYNWLERAEFRNSNFSFVLEPEPGQVFSPVGRGLFLLVYGFANTNPLPYRLAVLALHALNILLLYLVVERVFRRRVLALVAAFLFAVATSYDEVLFWVAALFHPLNAALCLAALLGLLAYLESGLRRHHLGGLLAFAAALLTKAPSYPFLLVLAAAVVLLERSRWRCLAPFGALWLAAAGLNLVLGLQHSYLLEQGYYRIGPHLVTNAVRYLAWIALPWDAAAAKLGAVDFYRMVSAGLEILLPIGVLAMLFVARARVRFFLVFCLATLVPFLPFVFEPVSRYTYLPAIGFAPVAAVGVLALGRLFPGHGRIRTGVVALIAMALVFLSLANTMVRDNLYEYRERLMVTWVEDVERVLPVLPAPPLVRIMNLPLLGVDRGIHLEAALRLAYSEPALRLEVLETPEPMEPGELCNLLVYESGRIKRSR